MAKKTRKAKAAGKKKIAGKKPARKKASRKKASAKKTAPAKKTRKAKKAAKKAPARKAAAPAPDGFRPAALAESPAVAPKPAAPLPAGLADPKNTAVVDCVNALMNTARPGWNDNGKMDADYRYNSHSMRAFLSSVSSCLQGKGYALDMNNDDFINACVTSTVYRLKRRVYDRTTLL
jgi:hypothetical protein